MLQIKGIINQPVTSNCFIISSTENGNCIIVDPGTVDNSELNIYLQDHQLKPELIILTHQHFDHIWGVNDLRHRFNGIKVVGNAECSRQIINSKENCSLFYDQKGFEVSKVDLITEEINGVLQWQNYTLQFFNTPGHSFASICFLIGCNLFTGDTLILNERTVTKLPKGSREELTKSMGFLLSLKGSNLKVYPGHGCEFELDDYDLGKAL